MLTMRIEAMKLKNVTTCQMHTPTPAASIYLQLRLQEST